MREIELKPSRLLGLLLLGGAALTLVAIQLAAVPAGRTPRPLRGGVTKNRLRGGAAGGRTVTIAQSGTADVTGTRAD